MSRLDRYFEKRDFQSTPEPTGGTSSQDALRYSVQMHAATRLHFDLRLEHDGVLLSFAVTRGPSLDPADKRLAVRTEDHPLDYLTFEGTIPKGNYGAGTVMLWDLGHWQPYHDVDEGFRKGHIHFALHGERLTGGWSLVRLGGRPEDARRENWLLIKDDDAAAHQKDPIGRYETSVSTARPMTAIAKGAPSRRHGPARRKAGPGFIKPQLAKLTRTHQAASDCWAELKLDGYRALVSLGRGGARIYTRNGHDWSERFAPLLPMIERLPAGNALIDAEIVAGAGLQGFAALQEAIRTGGPFRLAAFDILNLDGKDLRSLPLHKRRAALERLFRDVPPLGPLRMSPVVEDDIGAAFSLICDGGGEGLILKRKDAPYRSGRSDNWLKLKCDRRDDFVVVGWEPSTAAGRAFASLLIAEDTSDGLVYRGRVGTGFDDASMEDLARRFTGLSAKRPPVYLTEPTNASWLVPRLRIEVRYTEITRDGRLRHPVYLGLREDLMTDSNDDDRLYLAGVGLSSPNRKVFPGITKRALADYYVNAAPQMLPEVEGRAISLLRLPDGLDGSSFFQRHLGKGWPDSLRAERMGEREVMALKDNAGLVAAVQMGAVEFHIGGARLDRPDRPDRMVFDLDPDEGLSFARLRDAALEIRDDLGTLGAASWPLLTGGKGIHIVVPLRRVAAWESVTLFARTFAAIKAETAPERFTATISKSKRKGRVFIDWLRNDPAASAIAPYSVRARSGAPLAVPTDWTTLKNARRLPRQRLSDDLPLPPIPVVPAFSLTRSAASQLARLND